MASKDEKDIRRKQISVPSGNICPLRAKVVDAILRGEKVTQDKKAEAPKTYRLPSRADLYDDYEEGASEE